MSDTPARRVLLVEDDESVRTMIATALEHFGYDVVPAANGRDALQRFQERRPDVVLTDLIMPEKEGLETIRELRHLVPDVRIVAMSGGGRHTPHDYLQVALRMGVSQVLPKPFSLQELFDAIEAALGGERTPP